MKTHLIFFPWKKSVCYPLSGLLALAVICSALIAAVQNTAQAPTTLQHVIPAPPVGVQSDVQLGFTVAVDDAYTVVGAPFDDLQATDSGTVKVFNSSTGALLFVLANPNPGAGAHFGYSVGVSGTRVVVGVPADTVATSLADGRAYVYDLSSATPTVPVLTLNNPTPLREDQFGISVGISGTLVVVGTYGDDDSGAVDAGSAYVYDLTNATPGIPVFTLNNPTPALSDLFGYAVAISGMRVVVGAFNDDTGATDAGSAYVYDLGSGTPTVPVATLNNPTPNATDEFGRAVAISGTRVVVGALLNDTGANADGSAYVYDLTSATPTVPVLTLNNPSPFGEDQFGNAVGISGTLVVVGTYGDDAGAPDAGSTYVYDLNSATPDVPVMTLNNPTPALSDLFGYAVAISGTKVAVGAPNDDTRTTDAGSAYLYDLSSATPTTPVATLDAPSPSVDDQFGSAIAISGTLVVIGSPQEGTGAFHAGSAYVYDLSSATPTVPAFTLNNPNSSFLGGFGNAVAISGTRVVVGEYSGSQTIFADGRAYVYDLSSATPTVPVLTLNNPTPAREDQFGISVGISGTLVVVGTYGDDDSGAVDSGSAYVYDLTNATPGVPLFTLNNPTPAAGDLFGYSVAISGMRVVVGAFQDDTGATNAGSAYVYDLSSGTPTMPVFTLNNPSSSFPSGFGNAVAISGTLVVVGESSGSQAVFKDGRAYVYDLTSATPTVPAFTLNNPTPLSEDQFGISVGISDATVVIGTYGDDDSGAVDAGSAYVYDLTSATPTTPSATLNNPSPAQGDLFGFAVSISGMEVAVGAPKDDTVTPDKGSAYIFGPPLNPNECTVCHKRTATLTLPCNSLEYQRHLGHGDTAGPCPLQPNKLTRAIDSH